MFGISFSIFFSWTYASIGPLGLQGWRIPALAMFIVCNSCFCVWACMHWRCCWFLFTAFAIRSGNLSVLLLLCSFRCFSLFPSNYWKLMYTCAWELAATVTATTLCLGGNTITNLCHLFSNWVCCQKSYLELWPRQRRYAASLPCGSNAVSAGLCSTLENYTSAILDDPVAKVTTWFAFLSTCLFVSGWRA